VNVAARLEGLAEPGGICISEDAHRQVRGKLELTSEDMGEQKLKNIAEPVRVYRVRARVAAAARSLKRDLVTLPSPLWIGQRGSHHGRTDQRTAAPSWSPG